MPVCQLCVRASMALDVTRPRALAAASSANACTDVMAPSRLGETGIAAHPENEKLTHLIGKHAKLPLVGRAIRVVGDDYAARRAVNE